MWLFPGAYLERCIETYGVNKLAGGEQWFGGALAASRAPAPSSVAAQARQAVVEQVETEPTLRSESKLLNAMRLLAMSEESPVEQFAVWLEMATRWKSSRIARTAHMLLQRCASAADHMAGARGASSTTDGATDARQLLEQQVPAIREAFGVWTTQIEQRHSAREVAAIRTALALALCLRAPPLLEALSQLLNRVAVRLLDAPRDTEDDPVEIDIQASTALIRLWEADMRGDVAGAPRPAADDDGDDTAFTSMTAFGWSGEERAPSLMARQQLMTAALLAVRELNDHRLLAGEQTPWPLPIRLVELALNSSSAAVRRHAAAIVLQVVEFARDEACQYLLPNGALGLLRRTFGSSVILGRLLEDASVQVYVVKALRGLIGMQTEASSDGADAAAAAVAAAENVHLAIAVADVRASIDYMQSLRSPTKTRRSVRELNKALAHPKRAQAARLQVSDLPVDTRPLSEAELLGFVRRVCARSPGNRVLLEVLAALSQSFPWERWALLPVQDPSWRLTSDAALLELAPEGPQPVTEGHRPPPTLVDLDYLGEAAEEAAVVTTPAASPAPHPLPPASDDVADDTDRLPLTETVASRRPLADLALRRALYALSSPEPVRRYAALTLLLQVLRPAMRAPRSAMHWLARHVLYEAVQRRVRHAVATDASMAVRSAAATVLVYLYYVDEVSAEERMEGAAVRYAEVWETLQPFIEACPPREAGNFLREGALGYLSAAPSLAKLHMQLCEACAERFPRSAMVLSWLRDAWQVASERALSARDVHASLLRALDHPNPYMALAAAVFVRRFGVDTALQIADESDEADVRQRMFTAYMKILLDAVWSAVLSSNVEAVRCECVLAFATASALADEPFLSQALEALSTLFQRPGLGVSSTAKVAFDALHEMADARQAAVMMRRSGVADGAPPIRKCATRASSVVIALSGLAKPPAYFQPLK
ncbi:hypothetical protein CDCA_CDCA15G4048 [Cyanidium caldarium]|uniref:Condensin complex subunit 1 C-terminal domain-containing protein n=1 Tax=Cyanidium caldarium TaxID=2771 RepID=A0AAV9J1W1_CYACA|nr:hypothetical protein CDCA_CDCA15G4048 [Cyanidium caldarium]